MKKTKSVLFTAVIVASHLVMAGPSAILAKGEIGCRITTKDSQSEFLKLSLDESLEARTAVFNDFRVTIVNENNRVLIEKGEMVLASIQINQKTKKDQTTQETYVLNDTHSGELVVSVGCKRVK